MALKIRQPTETSGERHGAVVSEVAPPTSDTQQPKDAA